MVTYLLNASLDFSSPFFCWHFCRLSVPSFPTACTGFLLHPTISHSLITQYCSLTYFLPVLLLPTVPAQLSNIFPSCSLPTLTALTCFFIYHSIHCSWLLYIQPPTPHLCSLPLSRMGLNHFYPLEPVTLQSPMLLRSEFSNCKKVVFTYFPHPMRHTKRQYIHVSSTYIPPMFEKRKWSPKL